MGFRNATLRTKVVALLATLIALWSFAAWVTVRDGFNLFGVQTLDEGLAEKMEPLIDHLHVERRLSTVHLANPTEQSRAELASEREKTLSLTRILTEAADDWRVSIANDDGVEQTTARMLAAMDRLNETRAGIDAGTVDRSTAAQAFDAAIDSMFRVYDTLGQLDDPDIASDVAALIQVNHVRELLAREDALISGVLASGRITPAEHATFAQLVGAHRFVLAEAMADLPAADQVRIERFRQGGPAVALRVLEDRIIGARSTGRLPVEVTAWRAAMDPAAEELRVTVYTSGDAMAARATPVAIWIMVRLLVAAGLGLLAVLISVHTARALVRQLDRMRLAALQLANDRLPDVVARLGRGETVDVRAEVPPLEVSPDEIGQVAQAFNAAQETAVRTAVEQAELRRSVRDVFLSLARRTQALLHRQLALLDGMERREEDPDKLEELFRVDHLTTRMRRNAENLIVLSGASPGRAWRRNVPIVDVVRGAVAEVEDYSRVTVLPIGRVELVGRAVGDVIHLVAELIENALSFSPPHTNVQVRGQKVANGYVIEIEDRGLGMIEADRAAANERIAEPAEFTPSRAAQLGLFVVSRLAERHDVRVRLNESPYGGITAIVLIPETLVAEPGSQPVTEAADGPTVPLPARQRATRRPDQPVSVSTGSPGAAPAAPVAVAEPSSDPALGTLPGRPGAAAVRDNGADPTRDGSPAVPAAGSVTSAGLPVRVRQANLAPGLREEPPAAGPQPAVEESAVRCPNKVRQTMSSYQAGTRRARSEAAQDQATLDDGPPIGDSGGQPPGRTDTED